jgi:hypothetical protein
LFDDLDCLFFEPEETGSLVMLAHVYLDESADARAEKVYVAAGFIGTQSLWTELRHKWKIQLRVSAKKHGLRDIEYFSSKDCRGLRGPFFPLRDFGSATEMEKVALKIRAELETVITQSDIIGSGVAINMKDFREYNARPEVRANPHWNGDHEDAAFQLAFGVIAETMRQIEADGVGSHIAGFVCDDGPKKFTIMASFDRFKAKHSDLAKYMRGIAHLDDKKHPPLQMADLMADLAREMTGHWITNGGDKGKVSCRLPKNVLQVKCYDRDSMERVLRGDTPFA